MRSRASLLVLVSLSVSVCLSGCSSAKQASTPEWTPTSAPDLGEPVARIGDVPIYAKQVLAEARRQGTSIKAALDRLIEQNLLAEVAREQQRWPPSASGEVEEALVQRMLERDFESGLRVDAVPDSELRPLYQRVRYAFVHPRLVDIALLAIYTGAMMQDAPRKERAQAASELAAFVAKKKPKTLDEFMAIAKESLWAKRHVVARRLLQGLDKPLSRDIGEEIAKLHEKGQTTPLLTNEDGFFIARYAGERPPENISFEQAKAKLAAGYFDRWKKKDFIAFTSKLMQRHRIEAYYDRLPKND